MKIKTFPTLLVATLLVLGCSRNPRPAWQDWGLAADSADIIVKCKTLMTNERISYVIEEIWRDKSGGIYTNKIGDEVSMGPSKAEHGHNYGEGAVVFFLVTNDMPHAFGMVAIHNGSVPAWKDRPIGDLKSRVLNRKNVEP